MVKHLNSRYPRIKDTGALLRRMLLFSMLGALMIVLQVVFAFLPNIEFVSMLIIVYTCVFGWYALIPVYIFVALEILIYGFSLWVINYIYIWIILVLVVMPLRRYKSPVLWAIIAGIYGLLFGVLCSFTDIYIGGIGYAISRWISGLPYDFIHCGGNVVITLIFFSPMCKLLKYGRQKLKI